MKLFKIFLMSMIMIGVGSIAQAGEIKLTNFSEYEALVRKNKGQTSKVKASGLGKNQEKISFTSSDMLEIAPDKYTSSWQKYPLSQLDPSYDYSIDIHTDKKAYTPAFTFKTTKTSIGGPAKQDSSVFESNKIEKFLASYAEGVLDDTIIEKKSQIKRWIADGGRYAYFILYDLSFDINNPDQSIMKTSSQKEYFDVILSLMWYFYAEAINKGQKFEQGSFIVQDSHDRLFTFLHNYVKKMNPNNWKSVAGTLGSQNPYGYTRKSTHLYDSQEHGSDYNHYGIDARYEGSNGSVGSVQYIFPVHKSHILFGRIFPRDNKKRVFIKPEDYGLYVKDGLPMHAYELGFSVSRKIFGGNDEDHFRKERVEKKVIARMKAMFEDKRSPLDKSTQNLYLSQIESYGIQELVRLVYTLPNGWLKSSIGQYLVEIDKQYDHLSWRYGREVILTDLELISSIYYYLERGGFFAEAKKLQSLLTNLIDGAAIGFSTNIKKNIASFDVNSIKPYISPQATDAIRSIVKRFS